MAEEKKKGFKFPSAVVMGGLALGRVSYSKWLKFVLPLLIVLLVLYAVVMSIGAML